MLYWSHAPCFNFLRGEVGNTLTPAALVLHSLALRLRGFSLSVNQWGRMKQQWFHDVMVVLLVPLETTFSLALLLRMLPETELWTTGKKKCGQDVMHIYKQLILLPMPSPFFPFSCYLYITYTFSEHIQKEMDISLSLKTCTSSFNGSKNNIFLLMYTEFLFH